MHSKMMYFAVLSAVNSRVYTSKIVGDAIKNSVRASLIIIRKDTMFALIQ